jgi:hypothetical protein
VHATLARSARQDPVPTYKSHPYCLVAQQAAGGRQALALSVDSESEAEAQDKGYRTGHHTV